MRKIIVALPASYTFTGSDRAATFSVTATASIIRLKRSNAKIVRARLIPSGAVGLASAVGKIAGRVQCQLIAGKYVSPVFEMIFTKWDEWTPQNIGIGIEDHMGLPCDFNVVQSGTEFTCDDYNISDMYLGEKVFPMLEFEIECDGIIPIV